MPDIPGFFEGTEMPNAGWWEALFPNPAGILHAVGLQAGDQAIDLCCGDGWFTLQIARIARHVTGIDIDPALLESSRLRLTEAGVSNFDLVAGDAYEIAALTPRAADFVFLANAFHGVPDRPRLARAVREALRPTGQFAIVNWHQRPREETVVLGEPRGPKTDLRMPPEQTVADVLPAGFKLVRIADVPPYHYGAVFERA
jgi:ubiquinone/menaquinone biosynthesis C-methylase UbiE